MQESSALLELQSLDIEIIRAGKRLEGLPERQEILKNRAQQREVKAMREKAELLQSKLRSELKARQDEIAMLSEKLEHEQKRIMETADHRQVQSLTREMDGLKRRRDKLEMESLQYMERADKADGQVAKIDEALEGLVAKESDAVKRFQQLGGQIQDEVAALEAKRAGLAAKLSPELLSAYESARESKGGVGAGRLDGDTCSACRMSLPSQRLKSLVEGPDIGVCPQCRRLLVVRIEDSE
jgi:uncharacterized protein